MGARLEVRITPADVGRRVSVRVVYHGPDASATDVVGTLDAWTDGTLRIIRRDGTTASVRERDLLAAKVVPAPPPRRR